jgi:hypothetical protein
MPAVRSDRRYFGTAIVEFRPVRAALLNLTDMVSIHWFENEPPKGDPA